MTKSELTQHTPSEQAIIHPPNNNARHRAAIVILLIIGLLVTLWISDAAHSHVPSTPYRPQTQHVGTYVVTVSIHPAQPHAGDAFTAQLLIASSSGTPLPPSAPIQYQWNMLAMDMGTESGILSPSSQTGKYTVSLTAIMGGYWRLTITFPDAPHTVAAFDIPIQP